MQLTEITRFTRAAFGPTQAKKLSKDFRHLFHQLATFLSAENLIPRSRPCAERYCSPLSFSMRSPKGK